MSEMQTPLSQPVSLPREGRFLFIEAAWTRAAVGVLEHGRWRAFAITEGPAIESLFSTIESVLRDAGLSLSKISGYIYGEGPGSVLGLRTAAMALRAWSATPGLVARPVYIVNSLTLAAALANADGHGAATVFAASRRDRWNAFSPGTDRWIECDPSMLAATPGPHLRLPARDLGSPPVQAAAFDPIDALAQHPDVFYRAGLLRSGEAPDAANLANQYATWTGDRHKA